MTKQNKLIFLHIPLAGKRRHFLAEAANQPGISGDHMILSQLDNLLCYYKVFRSDGDEIDSVLKG